MDVVVTAVNGEPPQGTVLSIRAGETRRQAMLKINEVSITNIVTIFS
jgi:hypothetical protein